ncbi:GGDEF domain-containing protein [Microbacterium sp.]|uniref:GGDEF domain-containing protein n=1 Tax=Microbacterium sp. TaxID=51671 RepID=UPI0028A72B4F|nr:GGDEF domain-containing protein [Microbacterium sp.]
MVQQGIREADAAELGWLNASWLRRVRARTSTFSIVTAIMCAFFSFLMLIELFEDDLAVFEILLAVVVMVVGAGVAAAVLLSGRRLARSGGLILVFLHAAVSVYYIGFSDERQNAVASIQELPVMAMYLAWFNGARIGRWVEAAILLSVSAAMVLGPFGGVAVPGSAASGLFGPANIFGLVVMSWICLEIGFFVRHRVRVEAQTDPLTGALNRRGLVAEMSTVLRRASRIRRPVSIAVIDLDDFKAVNDGRGHDAGDAVLTSLVAQWTSLARVGDRIARLGGDEFVMLLPDTSYAGAVAMIERMHQLTLHPWSWGVVQLKTDEPLEDALRRADVEMYRHKRRQ